MKVIIELDLPADLAWLRLPEAVGHRLQDLLDRQDAGQALTAADREEAQGFVELVELLTLLRLRAEDCVAAELASASLTNAERQELERRLADSIARPNAVAGWEAIKARALARARRRAMTSHEVRALVESEIAGEWSRSNGRDCDLRRCLVTPEKRWYENPFTGSDIELWLVLDEDQVNHSGFKIVYDEQAGEYGLAWPGFSKQDVLLGWYGSFWDSFEGM